MLLLKRQLFSVLILNYCCFSELFLKTFHDPPETWWKQNIEPWLSARPSLLLSGFWHCSSPFSSVAVEGNRAAFVLKVSRNVLCSSVFQDGLSLPCCIKLLEITTWWERTARASPAAQETAHTETESSAFQTSHVQDWCLWATRVPLTWMDRDTGLLGHRAGGASLQVQAQPALTWCAANSSDSNCCSF